MFHIVSTTIKLIASITTVITLTVTPTSGKAPVTVVPAVTLTGPAIGQVCVGVSNKETPDEMGLIDCKAVNITSDQKAELTFETTGGKSGHTYLFKAVYLPVEEGAKPTASNTVEVVAE